MIDGRMLVLKDSNQNKQHNYDTVLFLSLLLLIFFITNNKPINNPLVHKMIAMQLPLINSYYDDDIYLGELHSHKGTNL